MLRKNSLVRSFLNRYMVGVICSILAIGLFWLHSSRQELVQQTEILQDKAIQQQMNQLRERVEHVVDMINHERQQLDNRMREQVKQRTLEAHAVMEEIYRDSISDHTEDQIAAMIRSSLRAITYNDGRGYYFATRLDGIEQLFPPNPKLEGSDFSKLQDSNGKYVVRDMIKIAQTTGEGFYEYTWTKPGSTGHHRKVAYIKYFPPLNWLVGTGEYVDDLISDLQQEMIARIESIKFKDGSYIFLSDFNGVSLAYPAKGRNMYEVEDSNGLKLVQEMIKIAKQGDGYLRYVMPPLGGERPEPKISYVTGLPEWEWYIGSGDFVADLDHELALMLAEQRAAINKKMIAIGASLAFFLLLGFFLSRQLGKQMSAGFENFQDFFARAARHSEPIDVQSQKFSEFSQLAESANQMLADRQRFEQEANRFRDQLRNVIDFMPSILVTISPDGLVTQWNKFAAASTGIAQSDALNKKLPLLLPFLQPHLNEIIKTTCQKQRVFHGEIEYLHGDITRSKQISAYPIGSPEPHSIVLRVDDVTERKMLEKTLVQSEKMLSVGGLAAGMAHEVNNPLSAIMQNLHLIKNRLSAENKRSRQLADDVALDCVAFEKYLAACGIEEKINHAMTSCERAATIVRNMLNFSRDGQSDFHPTDLAELLDNTLDLLANDYDFQRKYDYRQIQISRHYSEGMPKVNCEASKIQQVFFNLLKNGTQAMALANIPQERRRFGIDLEQDGEMAIIRIQDSGPGMPEGVKKRIFDPFFTTKAVGSGTGLGLFVSYFIIHDNHGGDISVDSVPGEGTTFTIKLPLQPPQR
ncbi:PAS domain S-box-containing protein [Malonomonas rubra DSM 5091]|uniref:histidine kinase n=1 Tax=Malonomonas rubra DSM 5091 TaxID=1122189 RepID=A0A1M6MMQ1_MALRU|nr:cache domain-containing protein [Malonomonas rubra]SHJ84553.1 PAS domain S-box-containing protein [Malonomonas rubra DSM 5091]